jgi:2,3-bisphosphoglycerate-independent phosphoglycerate mutase
MSKQPFVLMIIDGFGYSEDTQYNAIAQAETPNWNYLWQNYPHTLVDCSGVNVGLPDNQMGNSEVGHMNIGAGRIIYQELSKIDRAIADGDSGDFYNNQTLLTLLTDSKQKNINLQVIGLISDGGVHSHLRHYLALAKLAKTHNINKLYVHAFLDGRDTPPKSALPYLLELDNYLQEHQIGKIVSIVGRYYAMDRDKRWERTELAYNLLTNNFNIDNKNYFKAHTLEQALQLAYERGETDEFVKPTIIADTQAEYEQSKINHTDNLIFMNFRADRARQLSQLLIDPNRIKLNQFVTLTEYELDLTKHVVYKPQRFNNVLGEFLQNNNLTQLRIAETEKYAHVTFFFNGGREEPFQNEERLLVPSPKIKTYDLKPEMSAFELTDILCTNIESNKYDVIICNYANPDMVGHTGSLPATIKAIEAIDQCIGKVIQSIKKVNGQMFITADHGNAECMYDANTKQPHTAHTTSLVPLLYFNNDKNIKITKTIGLLQDIAPSLLTLMGYKPPQEMTGEILFDKKI